MKRGDLVKFEGRIHSMENPEVPVMGVVLYNAPDLAGRVRVAKIVPRPFDERPIWPHSDIDIGIVEIEPHDGDGKIRLAILRRLQNVGEEYRLLKNLYERFSRAAIERNPETEEGGK